MVNTKCLPMDRKQKKRQIGRQMDAHTDRRTDGHMEIRKDGQLDSRKDSHTSRGTKQ